MDGIQLHHLQPQDAWQQAQQQLHTGQQPIRSADAGGHSHLLTVQT
jgi:hypothetical protein